MLSMDDCNAKGHARYLFLEEDATRGPRTHFAVVNPNKPDNFDAAAELEGTSLNNNLLQRPDYTISLVGVLLRFRQDNTEFCCHGDVASKADYANLMETKTSMGRANQSGDSRKVEDVEGLPSFP